jgi:putative ATPase
MTEKDLFINTPALSASPLADRMRPDTLDDIIGQEHIVGQGRLLRRAIAMDRLSSLIFYGPPGTGKTSLARVISNTTNAHFESLNAVLAGVKDIRDVIENARERLGHYGKKTILFVDEVHRWNKAQQDALLPWVENGTIILVGATTENPFFEVNRALVSRSRIFQLLSLTNSDLALTVKKAISDRKKGYGKWRVIFEEGALEHLVEVASGDARILLNALELAVETTPSSWPPPENSEIKITIKSAEESIQRRAVLYDRDGDYHFDTISAFIKSVRGSDVDAALYWLARMVQAGEDPTFIFRRMIILASEDIGMADPFALSVVISCAESFKRIGFPEGNYPLSHACIYLATAPKSNSTMAFFDAMKEVEKENAEIPNHLKDSSRDRESFGHGEGYIYPHTFREHWTVQQYLPIQLQGKTFYIPSEIGYEGKIRTSILKRKEIQVSTILSYENTKYRTNEDYLSWSPLSKERETWLNRLSLELNKSLLVNRDVLFEAASPSHHDRILVLKAEDGLLLWEAARRAPEGITAGCVETETQLNTLLKVMSSFTALDELEKPIIACFHDKILPVPSPDDAKKNFGCQLFDTIICYEPWRSLTLDSTLSDTFENRAKAIKLLLTKNGSVTMLQSPPHFGERLSRILAAECCTDTRILEILQQAETDFFSSTNIIPVWDEQMLFNSWEAAGFKNKVKIIEQSDERFLTKADIDRWFDTEHSRWGKFIAGRIGKNDFQTIITLLINRIKQGPVIWKWKSLLTSHYPS